MNFLKEVRDSIYNPEFYRSQVLGGQTRPWRYFFKLIFVLSLIVALAAAWRLTPPLKQFFNFSSEWLKQSFPPELTLTIKDGWAVVSPEQVYEFPVVPGVAMELPSSSIKFVLVIDPTVIAEAIIPTMLAERHTLVLLTDQFLVSGLPGGETKITPLTQVPPLTINRDQIDDWLAQLNKFLPALGWLVGLLVFIAVFVLMSLTLVILLILTFLIQIIARAKNTRLSYSAAYRLGLHGITPGLLAQTLLLLFQPGRSGYGLPLVLTLVVVMINLPGNKKSPADAGLD